MKVLRRAFPVVAIAALTAFILPASAASRPSIAAAAAATHPSATPASETADVGRVAFTRNDQTVLSVSIPQAGLGIEVQWSKHQCSAGFVSPPEVFSWAGGKVPSSARPLLVPCKIKASSAVRNAKVGKHLVINLPGGIVCFIDSVFPYIHCRIVTIYTGPLNSSLMSDPYGGSEGHLSLFNSTIKQAAVVNAKGQVISRMKLPAGVNGVHYYANIPRRSTTTTIDFDDLPAGMAVSTQYDSRGVDFDKGIIGSGVYCYPVITQVSSSDARSGDQVADTSCANGEFSDSSIDGALKNNAQHISVYAGLFPSPSNPPFSEKVTLTAYDADGNVVGSDTEAVPSGQGTHTLLQISATSALITRFTIASVDSQPNVYIDDLAFDGQ